MNVRALLLSGTTSKIGRITSSSVITAEYPTTTGNTHPQAITAGPDGALWFTLCFGNEIGRLQ